MDFHEQLHTVNFFFSTATLFQSCKRGSFILSLLCMTSLSNAGASLLNCCFGDNVAAHREDERHPVAEACFGSRGSD